MTVTLKSPVSGIDISKWEPAELVDWDKMDEKVKVVIMKATELDWVDTDVHAHCNNIKDLGYKRSLYHFLHENDISKQIDKFLKVSREVGALLNGVWLFELPPVLDVEVKAVKKGKEFANQIKTWLDAVEKACGVKPIIYTSQNFWNNYVCSWNLFQGTPPAWTSDYPLWVAQYPYNPDTATDPGKLPMGWSDWIGWQYYDAYKFEAILYNGCDVNLFKQEYLDGLGDVVIPVPPPIGETTMYEMTTINNGTRVRDDHNVFAAVSSSHNANLQVTGNEVWTATADGNEVKAGDKWLKVQSVNGVTLAKEGWMAYIHKGVPICRDFKEVTTTPPTEPHLTHTILVDSDGKVSIDGNSYF